MLKKILIGIAGVLVVLLIVGFILPGKLDISKSITINAPAEYAFEEINNLENNPKWSYWNSIYPNMKVTYGDIKSGVGAISQWEGEESGNGKMTITESVPNESIKVDLDFMDQGTAKAWYTFEPDGEGTKVTTGFLVDLGMNPIMRLMAPLMMKPEMEKSFDYNLSKIKEIAEAKPKFTVVLSEQTVNPMTYIGISSSMSFADMKALEGQMGKSYVELFAALGKARVTPAGPPFCIIDKWDEATKQTDFTCAVQVAPDAKVPTKYKIMQKASSYAVKGINKGSYDNLYETHTQIGKYLEMKKLEMNGPVLEVYVTDPMTEKDTSKWITEVYYPIKKN
jgi:effector-binding domain-containing protein